MSLGLTASLYCTVAWDQFNKKKTTKVFFTSRTLVSQVHTNLNSMKVFTSSRYKLPTCTYNIIIIFIFIFFKWDFICALYNCKNWHSYDFFIELIQGSHVRPLESSSLESKGLSKHSSKSTFVCVAYEVQTRQS